MKMIFLCKNDDIWKHFLSSKKSSRTFRVWSKSQNYRRSQFLIKWKILLCIKFCHRLMLLYALSQFKSYPSELKILCEKEKQVSSSLHSYRWATAVFNVVNRDGLWRCFLCKFSHASKLYINTIRGLRWRNQVLTSLMDDNAKTALSQ